MTPFLQALYSNKVLLMDGAMGTELQRAGIADGACHEMWNVTHAEQVRAIHQAYVQAGADVLVTNTFQANPAALTRHALADQLEVVNAQGIALARSVGSRHTYVLASIGPFEAVDELPDAGSMNRMVRSLLDADALLLETWSDSLALIAMERFCRLAMEFAQVPTLLSLSYRQLGPGRLFSQSGHPPEWYAMNARLAGVAALGVNCGRDIGMTEVIEVVRRYQQVTDLPLFVRPNAGTPEKVGERWLYPHAPPAMAERLPELLAAGVRMIGGCCGTTPEHIAAWRPIVDQWNAGR
jgi:5-methyltetrahydrofolate--homocysteine methyltransferase